MRTALEQIGMVTIRHVLWLYPYGLQIENAYHLTLSIAIMLEHHMHRGICISNVLECCFALTSRVLSKRSYLGKQELHLGCLMGSGRLKT